MKKVLVIGLLLVIGSLSFSVENPNTTSSENSNTQVEEVRENEIVLSRRRSFLRAFGMHEKDDGGPNAENQSGSTAAAHTVGHAGAVSLTSIQNTPYSYKPVK